MVITSSEYSIFMYTEDYKHIAEIHSARAFEVGDLIIHEDKGANTRKAWEVTRVLHIISTSDESHIGEVLGLEVSVRPSYIEDAVVVSWFSDSIGK